MSFLIQPLLYLILLPQRAASLDTSDSLATLLYQVSSPAHIPFTDTRYQELLHGYDVWVHLEASSSHSNSGKNGDDNDDDVVQQACASMAKHAANSSNLAALALHLTRMVREFGRDLYEKEPASEKTTTSNENSHNNPSSHQQQDTDTFSQRISRVAKARAVAGALQLFQILLHPVIVKASSAQNMSILDDSFTYTSRGDLPRNQTAGLPLLHALLDIIALVGTAESSSKTKNNNNYLLSTPEIYDAMVRVVQLVLVLLSTQLYQPFLSSFQAAAPAQYALDELFRAHPVQPSSSKISDSSGDDRMRRFNGSFRSSIGMSPFHNNNPNDLMIPRWTPATIVQACLLWQVRRPPAPERSIAHYHCQLAIQIAASKAEVKGVDGLYESHLVVTAATAASSDASSPEEGGGGASNSNLHASSSSLMVQGNNTASMIQPHRQHQRTSTVSSSRGSSSGSNIILDATKGVLVLSSSIILLPFRLMSLVLGVWSHKSQGNHNNKLLAQRYSATQRRTKDVLWLSESPLTDLASSLLLLVVHNHRQQQGNTSHDQSPNQNQNNVFRQELAGMLDDRWAATTSSTTALNGLPDLPGAVNRNNDLLNSSLRSLTVGELLDEEGPHHPHDEGQALLSSSPSSGNPHHPNNKNLAVNFESLFLSFGRIVHTEIGALLLYTLIQTCPAFAESLSVRSDLDTLVMPVLRTLYFASSSKTYVAQDFQAKGPASSSSSKKLNIRNCPFRSLSQLYVIVILLLLFSQDSSFGSDAFRRITVIHVPWYKERNLKQINLGSVILLVLLRSLLFNLHRLQDGFLLSNCCAVLMNVSPAMVELHDYAAMRLASVTTSAMKRHVKLASGISKDALRDEEEDTGTQLGMYSQVARTLLSLVKHALSAKNLERNLHLVYSLVYHMADLQTLFKETNVYAKSEIDRIRNVMEAASDLLTNAGARTAAKAIKVLETNQAEIIKVVEGEKKKRKEHHEDDFNFTYEEEADPEIFFVPYVWETIVTTVTASSIEWDKDKILAFDLLEEEEQTTPFVTGEPASAVDTPPDPQNFAKNVEDVV